MIGKIKIFNCFFLRCLHNDLQRDCICFVACTSTKIANKNWQRKFGRIFASRNWTEQWSIYVVANCTYKSVQTFIDILDTLFFFEGRQIADSRKQILCYSFVWKNLPTTNIPTKPITVVVPKTLAKDSCPLTAK